MMKSWSLSTICLLALCQWCMAAAPYLQWVTEAEGDGHVTWSRDSVADIHATGGLTLWFNHEMHGNVVIEYDARIVGDARVSDLNCFWMAQWKKGSGRFLDTYAMPLYYVGYGGNHNSTTRFRRYSGDVRGVDSAQYRPPILREYLDSTHLLKADHWYHIRLEQRNGRALYYIDGECLVDYADPMPLTSGYFGFRTTLAHAQMKNFRWSESPADDSQGIMIRNIMPCGGKTGRLTAPTTFGIPFMPGEVTSDVCLQIADIHGKEIPLDQWTLAHWPDGSAKWIAVATVATADTLFVKKEGKQKKKKGNSQVPMQEYILHPSANNSYMLDSISHHGKRVIGRMWVERNGEVLPVSSAVMEQQGSVRNTWKFDGKDFCIRFYTYNGAEEIKLVCTTFIDSLTNTDGLSSLSVKAEVPLNGKLHRRTVAFAGDDGKAIRMDVKPLKSRRRITLDDNDEPADPLSRSLLPQLAEWDGFRLSQLSPNAFSVRKRATSLSPWIGTIEGHRSPGLVAVGDAMQSVTFHLEDFWQSYPSTLLIDSMRSHNAVVSLCLWSSEAERMMFCHYDTVAHGLEAAYEDVQPGMSTALGTAHTSTIYITPSPHSIDSTIADLGNKSQHKQFLPTPEYLHRKRAFGIWSLDSGTAIDTTLYNIVHQYAAEQERNSWYGFFNYGDVMHTYDAASGEWMYDVGGFAWDNTELATPAMLWYEFLRTGSPLAWRMAEAMSRHNAEVDCYHRGPHAALGTRHNVLHWGCGAKEARISQAFFNRFLYYLTADERMGDIMSEVRDADQLLYTLDPMRLAQPRSEQYPCTTPARLRIGPDWLAYAGNWFTEWERTGNTKYRDKILAGMNSIAAMPHGIFTGPKALGYDPATGIISWEGGSDVMNTNHLLSIMGGFEMMNEMMMSLTTPAWNQTWLTHAMQYKEKAMEISRNHFRIPRLKAYAYWLTGKPEYSSAAKADLRSPLPLHSTNSAATYGLDAIFMQEVIK